MTTPVSEDIMYYNSVFGIADINDTDHYIVIRQDGENISDIEVAVARGRSGVSKAMAPMVSSYRQTLKDVERTIELLRNQLTTIEEKVAELTPDISTGNYTPEVLEAFKSLANTRSNLEAEQERMLVKAMEDRVHKRFIGGAFDPAEPLSEEEAEVMKFPEGVEPTLGNFVIHGHFRNKLYLVGSVDIRTTEIQS